MGEQKVCVEKWYRLIMINGHNRTLDRPCAIRIEYEFNFPTQRPPDTLRIEQLFPSHNFNFCTKKRSEKTTQSQIDFSNNLYECGYYISIDELLLSRKYFVN